MHEVGLLVFCEEPQKLEAVARVLPWDPDGAAIWQFHGNAMAAMVFNGVVMALPRVFVSLHGPAVHKFNTSINSNGSLGS